MKDLFRVVGIFVFLGFCMSIQANEGLLKDCLETVKDPEKCNELLRKAKDREEGKEKKHTDVSNQEKSALRLRKDIKNALQSKTRLYVIKYLGEPDERFKSGPDFEYFIYKKPLSRRSENDQPDQEIKVVFRRDMVSEVLHISPPNESKTQLKFKEASKQHK